MKENELYNETLIVSMRIPIKNFSTNKLYLMLPGSKKNMSSERRFAQRILSPEARQFKDFVKKFIKLKHKKKPSENPIKLVINLFFKNYPTDIDSVKALIDCMSGIIFSDDKQIVELCITKKTEKTIENSIEITAYELVK